MLGWGPEEERLRATAPNNVEIISFERGKTLYDAFARARLFLFPSRAETFGLVLVEAMAAGCAIVSSIPLPYAGATVRPGDTAAFIAAAREIWSRPEAMREFGAENVRRAEFFNWRRAIDEQLDVYREVLGAASS
jgi:glycosyltransferase involved in cell wall biosynthesis